MIHTLRALRNNCDLLLNTMDIFVKEPSVDWLVSTHNTELFRLCLKDMIVLCTSYLPFSFTGFTFIKSFLQVNAEKQMNEMKVEGMYIHTVCIRSTCICST